jgi:DNA-binding MarR family transcriptional regulator
MKETANSFGFLLQDVARLMRRNFNRDIQDLDLTQAQWQILFHVARNEGLRQAQLAEILEMQPISVARQIDRMEAAGWLRRVPDPGDRRAVNLYVEKKAEPILETLRSRGAALRRGALKGISEEEQKIFTDVLARLRGNLSEQ